MDRDKNLDISYHGMFTHIITHFYLFTCCKEHTFVYVMCFIIIIIYTNTHTGKIINNASYTTALLWEKI